MKCPSNWITKEAKEEEEEEENILAEAFIFFSRARTWF